MSDIRVRRRFLRSVHLERDFYAPGSTDGYVPTPAALSTLRRILAGVRTPAARAFSITGAYGSGKSAFALTLAKSLSAAPWGDEALRCSATESLNEPLFDTLTDGLFPVLIVGGREPVASALIAGLRRAVTQSGVFVLLPETPAVPTAAQVAAFYEAVSRTLRDAAIGVRGLLIIVDEAGKFLEYAAQHPENGDLQALQEMAEAAVRSPQAAPLFFVTVFHQAFDEYAGRLSAKERGEWRKVQGRFADIAFADAPEETLRLVSRAMERTPNAERDAVIRASSRAAAARAAALNLLPRTVSETEFAELVDRTYPLHPLTLLALPHVFRRFGQGERSLFAFLAGDEPGGLADFLAGGQPVGGQYTLDRLYDYLLSSVGASALIGAATSGGSAVARLWSETQESVERAADTSGASGTNARLPALAAPLAKIIGLLHVLENGAGANLPASGDVLAFAATATDADTAAALDALQAATLIQYRRFKNAYKPYEGSDVDVEELLREARATRSGLSLDVAATAAKLAALAGGADGDGAASTALLPVVARRHLFETGTLRLFEQVLTRPERLQNIAPRTGHEDTDGTLLLCVAGSDADARAAETVAAQTFADRADIIVVVLTETEAVRETARTVELLLAVRESHPEIGRDRVAEREVRERFADAQAAFGDAWERLLFSDAGRTVYAGQVVPQTGARARQQLVSAACDKTYPHTPRLPNELINRRALSSVAAAARRNLFEAMLVRGDAPRCGISGFPPERSMYASLLHETGIHRETEGGRWAFGAPDAAKDPGLRAVWDAIEVFLFGGTAELRARPLPELYTALRLPPFGVSEGIIPVLLCACLLCHADEVLLYESGAFVTVLDAATFERLAKRPEGFSIHSVQYMSTEGINKPINDYLRSRLKQLTASFYN